MIRLIYSKGTRRITDKNSDKITHYLRYKNDSIMISSKTLNIDIMKTETKCKTKKELYQLIQEKIN